MRKKLPVRTLIDSQHVKESEILLKSTPQYFRYIYWSLSKKISFKNSFLEVSEMTILFGSILTSENKYILSVKASV